MAWLSIGTGLRRRYPAIDSSMDWQDSSWLTSYTTELWILAVLFFGVGDIVSTTIGLSMGAVELHPIVGDLVEEFVLLAMLPLKTITILACYALWRLTPEPYRAGVPLGLAMVGIFASGWNVAIILQLI